MDDLELTIPDLYVLHVHILLLEAKIKVCTLCAVFEFGLEIYWVTLLILHGLKYSRCHIFPSFYIT